MRHSDLRPFLPVTHLEYQRRKRYEATRLGRAVLVAESNRPSAQMVATRNLREVPGTRGGHR